MGLLVTTTTTTTAPPNLVSNGGGESGSLSPWIAGGGGTAILDGGTAGPGYSPHSGSKQFYGGASASNTLTQNINILTSGQGLTTTQIDTGTLTATVQFYERSYYQSTGSDRAQIKLIFRSSTGTAISTVTTPNASCTSGYCFQTSSFTVPTGTRSIDYIMIFTRASGTNLDAYIDDNSLTIM